MDSPAQNLKYSPRGPISSLDLDEPLILKIFPPFLRGQFVSERAALAQLRGRLAVPIPEIVFEGERDQWPYLVITRVYGQLGSVVWPRPA
jgi:hygromycin-B 7''-O-kinase